jgi:hypothetical protein
MLFLFSLFISSLNATNNKTLSNDPNYFTKFGSKKWQEPRATKNFYKKCLINDLRFYSEAKKNLLSSEDHEKIEREYSH